MSSELFDLGGRVALVTGGNAGLGQGIALALAKAGADIAVASRQPASETAALVRALGRRCVELRADLTSIEPIPGMIERTLSGLGRLDILVNAVFLASRASDYVNGAIIPVDGGWLARYGPHAQVRRDVVDVRVRSVRHR